MIERGELDAAEQALGADSSVDAMALRGWVALYRGDLTHAARQLHEAGPYAGRPGEATERARMLALVQRIGRERSPELGAALLLLARRDSLAALPALREVGRRLPGRSGAGVLLLAGQVAARLGPSHDSTATALFAEVVAADGAEPRDAAVAPAAELEWARLLLRRGEPAEAITHFERLILTYPESALVPQARRELEQARGTIPRS